MSAESWPEFPCSGAFACDFFEPGTSFPEVEGPSTKSCGEGVEQVLSGGLFVLDRFSASDRDNRFCGVGFTDTLRLWSFSNALFNRFPGSVLLATPNCSGRGTRGKRPGGLSIFEVVVTRSFGAPVLPEHCDNETSSQVITRPAESRKYVLFSELGPTPATTTFLNKVGYQFYLYNEDENEER